MEPAEVFDYETFEVVDVAERDWQQTFEDTFPIDDELKEAIRLYRAGEGPAPEAIIRKYADDSPRCVIFVDSANPNNVPIVSN